jgi:plastocyanin
LIDMSHILRRGVAVPVLGALFLVSCGGGGSSSPASPTSPSPTPGPTTSAGSTVTVSIVSSVGNSAFVPNPVRANTGDTVVFRNNDAVLHRVVMNDGSADLGDIAPGATSRGFTLSNANATNYRCTLHGSMVGSINGAQAPTPDCVPDVYGYGCQ